MGWLTGSKDSVSPTVVATQAATKALEEATARLAEVEGELDARLDSLNLVEERNQLKKEVADLEIEKSKVEEDHARERREIEHKTGLVLDGAEKEAELARQEAELKVREENLAKDEERFKEHLEFVETRFREHTETLKDTVEAVLQRLPDVNATLSVGEFRGELPPKDTSDKE